MKTQESSLISKERVDKESLLLRDATRIKLAKADLKGLLAAEGSAFALDK